MIRALTPYAVALLVPATALGVLYALEGRSPLWGLIGGGIGLVGALLAAVTRFALTPAQPMDLDDLASQVLDDRKTRADIPREDEPPERG